MVAEQSVSSSSVELVHDRSPIGEVAEVSNASVAIVLSNKLSGALGVGDYVIIEAATGAVVGRVARVRHDSRGEAARTMADVELRATLFLPSGKLKSGVALYPAVGSKVFRPSPTVVQSVVEDKAAIFGEQASHISLKLARTADSLAVPLEFTPERLFGRHLAILGTSGAGKSWSVARVIEQCAASRSKVLLLDPTGEYEALTDGVFHVHLGMSRRADTKSNEASLPYRDLTEADLVAIFRPSSGTQYLKLRSAIKTLKLLQCEPKLGADGVCIKGHKSKVQFEAAYKAYKKQIEHPNNHFDINRLAHQIELECVDPNRSSTEPHIWGGVNQGEHSACIPMINRIQDILSSEELQTIFRPSRQPSIFQALHSFLKDPNVPILRISFEFLPASHRVREVVANSIGRHLLALARDGQFRPQPMLVVLDEAHQALNSALSDLSGEFPLEAFNIIAKEGRKYALTLLLATQRPRDIPEDVLSQVGTFIVHRLVNDSDRHIVERASGAVNNVVLEQLPGFSTGEALLMGIDFPVPTHVKMEPPKSPPRSEGPNYQRNWSVTTIQ